MINRRIFLISLILPFTKNQEKKKIVLGSSNINWIAKTRKVDSLFLYSICCIWKYNKNNESRKKDPVAKKSLEKKSPGKKVSEKNIPACLFRTV